jgi:hypothetical protein
MIRGVLLAAIVAWFPHFIHTGGGGVSVSKFWDDERVSKLRELVDSGGFSAAAAHFSDRSEGGIRQACAVNGISLAGKSAGHGNDVVVARNPGTSGKKTAAQKLTIQEKYDARIAATQAKLAQLAAERDYAAAQQLRRAQEREAAAKNRKTKRLEKLHAAAVKRAEDLRMQICTIKADYVGPTLANGTHAAKEPDPIAMPGGPLKATIDKGDTDIVRKRLTNFVVPQLVRDLRVAGPAVYACIEQLAKAATK